MLLDCNLLELYKISYGFGDIKVINLLCQQPSTQFIITLICYWKMCVWGGGGVACRSMSHDWHNNNLLLLMLFLSSVLF